MKVFDKVDHDRIYHKLQVLGIAGKLDERLHDFLKYRRLQTMVLLLVKQFLHEVPLLFIIALLNSHCHLLRWWYKIIIDSKELWWGHNLAAEPKCNILEPEQNNVQLILENFKYFSLSTHKCTITWIYRTQQYCNPSQWQSDTWRSVYVMMHCFTCKVPR